MAMPSFSVAAEPDLSCPVCFNLFKDPHTPKELDCSHVCCAPCIQKMIEGGRRVVDCPECRHVTQIPEEGISGMKTIYRLRSLSEKHHALNTRKETPSGPGNPDSQVASEAICAEHKIGIDYFCQKCLVAGCSSCIMFRHRDPDHEVINIDSASVRYMGQMMNIFDEMNAKLDECSQSYKELDTLETDMVNYCKEQKGLVDKHIEQVVVEVKAKANRLKASFDSIEQPKIERVRIEKGRLKKHMMNMRDIKSSAENTLATSPTHRYVEQHAAVSQSVIGELGKANKHLYKAPKDLNPAIGKARIGTTNLDVKLGTVLRVKPCVVEEVQDIGLWKSEGCCISVAVTSDDLLVTGFSNNVLHLYSKCKDGKYKKETSIALSKLVTTRKPMSVAISPDGKCLVVRHGKCIEIYSLSGEYEGILDLKPSSDGKGETICNGIQPQDLKVEEDGSLLVADYNGNIVQFTSDGVYKHSIATVVPLLQIATMPNGKIAGTNSRVSKLFIGDMESGMESLTVDVTHANALCYHRDSDTLLIGRCLKRKESGELDETTGVIEQYCPTSGRLVQRAFERADGSHSNPYDMVVTNDGMLVAAETLHLRAFSIIVQQL